MVFSSFSFLLLFFPAVLLIYFLMPGIRGKNIVLCLASLLFYSWGEPLYLFLMLASVLINYLAGLGIERFANRKKGILIADVVFNIGALAFFKYTDFLIGNVNQLTGASIPPVGIALPLGISFYTFQIMSYVIDVYRGQTKAQQNIILLTVYISLFPQLVAGPIVRYDTVEAELRERRTSLRDFGEGLSRFLYGLGKKVIIANQMALVADSVFDSAQTVPAAFMWLGIFAYALQIYYDFSGYSDMAIGMGRIFGFHFDENFNYPYMADSVTDFWRRWHISLSGWFREYVYIPLGGNRRGQGRQILNMMVVWLLTGMWHGASWNFVLWGVFYGVALVLEKTVLKNGLKCLPSVLKHGITLLVVLIGWAIFRADGSGMLPVVLERLFVSGSGTARDFLTEHADLLQTAVVLPVAIIGCFPLRDKLISRFGGEKWFPALRYAGALLIWLVSLGLLLGNTYNPFIYFRF